MYRFSLFDKIISYKSFLTIKYGFLSISILFLMGDHISVQVGCIIVVVRKYNNVL